MKILLTTGDHVISATLAESDEAHAFAKMLPLDITLYDLFSREKFGALPRSMPEAPLRTRNYFPGEIIYWSVGPDLAILHTQDGRALTGKFNVIGKIDHSWKTFEECGPMAVRIEREHSNPIL